MSLAVGRRLMTKPLYCQASWTRELTEHPETSKKADSSEHAEEGHQGHRMPPKQVTMCVLKDWKHIHKVL